MKKKYLLYLIISLIISSVGVRFLVQHKQQFYDKEKNDFQKVQNELKELAQISSDGSELFSGNELSGSFDDSWSGEFLSGVANFSGTDSFTIKQLEENYTNAVMIGDEALQAQWLEKMYIKTQDTGLLYMILNKYMKIYDYKKALQYVMKIRQIDPDMQKFGVKPFLNLLFNSLEFTNKNVAEIKSFLKTYKDKGFLNADDEYFYHSLIALGKLDFQTFETDISQINTGGDYKDFLLQIQSAKDQYKLYKDVAPYYLNGLLSYVLFDNGYYNISQKLAYDTLKLNENYILPNQIVAYSNFIMGRSDQAKKYLTKLIEIDFDNSQDYKFLLGVSQFWNGKYEDSIVFLSQINKVAYLLDSYRYMMLGYYNINDYDSFQKYLGKLVNMNGLNEYDYYSIFDLVFFKDYQHSKRFDLYNKNSNVIKKVIVDCYKKMTKSSKLVCAYGRGGFYFASGNKDKTLTYFLRLVEYYPRNYFYEVIGDLYAQKSDVGNAKKYYVNAMLFSQDVNEKKSIKDKIITTIMQHKK